MKHAMCAISLLTVLAILGGCGKVASPTPLTQTAGSLSATLVIIPDPPVPMEDATLELTLLDVNNQPVSGATVRFDLTMPGMQMPINCPEATDEGDGIYRASAIFTMAGEWQIQVEVAAQAEGNEAFTFVTHTK